MTSKLKLLSTSILLTTLAACHGGEDGSGDNGITSTDSFCNEPATTPPPSTSYSIKQCVMEELVMTAEEFAALVADPSSTSLTLDSANCNGNVINDDDGLDQMTALETLNLVNTELNYIDLSNNTKLTSLNLGGNELSCLDLSNNTLLEEVYAHENSLESINLSGLTALESLNLNENYLESINLSGLIALKGLYLLDNQFTSIDLSGLTELEYLFLGDNLLTSINLSGLTALKGLGLDDNNLNFTDIADISTLADASLDYLWLSGNTLSDDVKTALDELEQNTGIYINY